VRISSQNYDSIKAAVLKSLNLIDFNFGRDVNKIVIKPNMCYYYHPSTGETTDPQFVSALIDVFRDNFPLEPEIFVVESDASAMKCKYAFRILGYDKMVKEKDVSLVNLSEAKNRIVDVEVNDSRFSFHVPEIFYESDLTVNVPKMKYMKDVKITCALKNMFGCNALSRKLVYHKAINEAIVGINKQIRTDLIIVDGLIACGKHTKKLNLVMSSEDPVAVDAAASKFMGINPKSVRQIVLASNEGIGNLEFTPVGDFSYFVKGFPKKSFRDNIRESAASVYLRIFE
jgi:uncharacterized protein (DUF362 family)